MRNITIRILTTNQSNFLNIIYPSLTDLFVQKQDNNLHLYAYLSL